MPCAPRTPSETTPSTGSKAGAAFRSGHRQTLRRAAAKMRGAALAPWWIASAIRDLGEGALIYQAGERLPI